MSGERLRAAAIPSNVRKMIQNIKEITGNHSDDEIYIMLKECSMDPNETAQKLLLQDTFHEVKRKRDRKKETQNNRDAADMRWRSGPAGRGGRGGRGNYTSRYAVQDAGVVRNTAAGKENGINQASDKTGLISSTPIAQDANSKDVGSSMTVMANGPVGVVSGGAKNVRNVEVLSGSGTEQPDMSLQSQRQLLVGANKRSYMASGGKDAHVEAVAPPTLPGISSSASDLVLVPSDSGVLAAISATKREVGNLSSSVEPNPHVSTDHKLNAGKVVGKPLGVGKTQGAEFSQSHGGSSSSRPLSNYGNRSQQAMGSQKVGPNKEWKPKPTNANAVHGPKTLTAPDNSNVTVEVSANAQPVANIADSEEATKKLHKEMENLQVRDAQHVIIPNHIHVPAAVRSGLSFGSFDSPFVINASRSSDAENQNNSKPVSGTHQETEAVVEDQTASQNSATVAEDMDNGDSSRSPEHVPENLSSTDVIVPSSSVPDSGDSKKETASGPQHPNVNTSVSYNFGLMAPILGNPLGPVEASESQALDVSRVPSFVVQPPVDPSSFCGQFYRSGQDIDGRISPYPAPAGVAAKYTGNVAVLPSQSPPEGGNSMVLSTTTQTPLATQAAGVMPSSVTVTQQPMALFRQPPGVHIPHYPPNYLPYGHYFSPFYVPPPAMHQFLGNNAFPQQAQAGSVYPGPAAAAAAATAVKFPISQYKPGSNPGNSAHMGVGGSYGPYGASPAGYNTGSAATAGNSTGNEELAASQYKESNVYITGQQSEGSAVWIPTPGREMSGLPANSFYNLPPQGQHVTFAPTQAGQGAFAGMYHPAQAVTAASVHPLLQQSQAMPGAVDMVGATASVYQQPQHAQMNWPNNY